MAAKSSFLANKIDNLVLRNTAFTPPATVFLALLTAITNGYASSVTEVSGGAYAREGITFAAPDGTSTVASAADVVFPTATAAWGTVVGWGIYDAATVGNLLYFGTFTASKAIGVGDVAKVVAGQLTLQET